MISKDLVAASAKSMILSILSEGESYGYEIIQKVRQISGGEMQWRDGMLYPVLHRLEKQGYIDATWRESDNGRRRKYYRIKVEGRKALETEKEAWMLVHSTLIKLWGRQEPALT